MTQPSIALLIASENALKDLRFHWLIAKKGLFEIARNMHNDIDNLIQMQV